MYKEDESCPPPEERPQAMMSWTCKEYDEYWKLLNIRRYINYATMSAQVLTFLVLFFLLIR